MLVTGSILVTGYHLRHDSIPYYIDFTILSIRSTSVLYTGTYDFVRERDRGSGWSLSYDSRHRRCSFVYLENERFNLLTRLS